MRILLSSSLSLWWAVMAPAQTVPLPIPASLNQTQGSGMIGVAINQTARLNVLNSAAPPPADSPIATPACKVTLQVFDDQNTKLGESRSTILRPAPPPTSIIRAPWPTVRRRPSASRSGD